jgi:hypothetical protein
MPSMASADSELCTEDSGVNTLAIIPEFAVSGNVAKVEDSRYQSCRRVMASSFNPTHVLEH